MAKYAVQFEIGFYVEVEAESENEALEEVKDNLHKYGHDHEGEAHGFEVELV